MRYQIVGADASGKERTTVVEAPSETEAVRIAKQQGLFTSQITQIPGPAQRAQSQATPRPPTQPLYIYKMVQVPPTIVIREQRGSEAAAYLEGVVNTHASNGWEFYRIDSIGVRVPPGCLGSF